MPSPPIQTASSATRGGTAIVEPFDDAYAERSWWSMVEILSVLVMLGTGVVAGVLFAVAISVMPALIAMDPARYVDTHKLLGRRYDRIMPFIVGGSFLVDVAFAFRAQETLTRALFAAAAISMAGVAAVSQARNVPINNVVKKTHPEAIGQDWQDPRKEWRDWHIVRTCFAFSGCALTSAAIVLS